MGLYNTHYTVEIIGTTVHVLHINVFYGYHRVIHVLDNMVTTDDELSVISDKKNEQYNTTTQQLPTPIYSTLACFEGGAPADYSVITETQLFAEYSMIGDTVNVQDKVTKEETPADYSMITEAQLDTLDIQDTSDGGMVYSAVVVKDGKKTTVLKQQHRPAVNRLIHQIMSNLWT